MYLRFTSFLVCAIFSILSMHAHSNKQVEEQIESLMDNMTIEEKVGQMTLLVSTMFMREAKNGNSEIDLPKLQEAIHKYKVGAIFNPPEDSNTLTQWHDWVDTAQKETDKTRLKIPLAIGVDSIHGASFTEKAVLLPHNINLGASRNIQSARESARITALETMAGGIYWNFDPVLDVGRQPLWPRLEETFGEDTYIVQEMGLVMIETYEGLGMAATMKHFLGYSEPASGKDRTPAYIPDPILWQLHAQPFKKAVDFGVSSVMVNSSSVNGVPLHADKYWLTDVLKNDWGFKGVTVTDWSDIKFLHTRHNVAPDIISATEKAINAGIDMSMVPRSFEFCEILTNLVKEGRVSESRIEQAVKAILRMKFKMGLFDGVQLDRKHVSDFGHPSYTESALSMARESITLLKNEKNILPLDKKQNVLLIGPAANNHGALHGSWSYTWQGKDESQFDSKTIRSAFEAFVNPKKLQYFGSTEFNSSEHYNLDKLNIYAKKADVIVLALGEESYAEQPGAIDDLTLPQEQLDLIRRAKETGKPIVVILAQGRPRIIEPVEQAINAILLAYRPGSRGAEAIVETLYGENNPSGLLPYTYPKFTGDIFPYNHHASARIAHREPGVVTENAYQPQWPFGFGLSYTEFKISKLTANPQKFKKGQDVKISFEIKNIGKRQGKKAIDLFVKDHYATDTPLAKSLRRFTKLELNPGESKQIEFTLNDIDFSYINRHLKQISEPGTFSIEVDQSSVEVELIQ